MRSDSFLFEASDGMRIFVYRWLPAAEAPPRATIQIAHGMGEHAGRYARLAEVLTAEGYAVLASDHRGHGRTAASESDLGHFADSDGWNRVVADLRELSRHVAETHPGARRVLLGHSMGSQLAEQLLQECGDAFDAAALSGSPGHPGPIIAAAHWLARAERLRVGRRGHSALLRWVVFGRANRAFAPVRTASDWLSRDPAEVDRYEADPRCGFVLSAQSFCDMFSAMRRLPRPDRLSRLPRKLPVYVLSGESDPVHDGLRSLRRLLLDFEGAGLARVSHRFYPGARHELFNETNRDEVSDQLLHWLASVGV